MSHLTDELLLRHLREETTEAEDLTVCEHLATCATCLDRVRTHDDLRRHFEEIWTAWSATEHARLAGKLRLSTALEGFRAASPELWEQARTWLTRIEEGLTEGIHLLLDRSRRIASAAEGFLEPSCRFELRPAVVGVARADLQAQLEEQLKRGSELLGQRRPEEAAEALLRATGIDERSPQAAVSRVYRREVLSVEVAVNARLGRVSVRCWPGRFEGAPGMALLLPQEPGLRPLAATFQPDESGNTWLAEFTEVPNGAWSLCLGPAGDPE